MELKKKALNALLALQRHSWEQSVTAQACLESGEIGRADYLAR